MFTAGSVLLILAFAFVALVAPFRFPGRCAAVLDRAMAALASGSCHAAFGCEEGRDEERMVLLRAFGVLSGLFLLGFLLRLDAPFADHPASLSLVFFHALLALIIGGALVGGARGIVAFLPRWRVLEALGSFGFRTFWVQDPAAASPALREALAARIPGTSRVGILDVTGHELIGKGPGPSGGLLYDALAAAADTPVHVLLLQPETQSLDPDARRATVFQTVLAEMDVSPQTYIRRVRATLEAVEALNEKRRPEARIEVRFYAEKPTVRVVIFDESAFVSAWVPRENVTPAAVLEVAREARGPTLFEAFRLQFARLWTAALQKGEASAKAGGFKSVAFRRQPSLVTAS
ncbi:MAG: hypothetical protein HY721_33295 [Planctomycetes bacterium]|nr:hypothetical protein [Planctomycetota bacterium]